MFRKDSFATTAVACLLSLALGQGGRAAEATPNSKNNQPLAPVDFEIKLDTITSGFDGKTCWVSPRVGVIPGSSPILVCAMQKLLLSGSDVFFAINDMRSDDMGKTWSAPREHGDTLGRRKESDGIEVVIAELYPKWHAKSGKLLGTGSTPRYKKDARGKEKKIDQGESPARTAYSIYNPEQRTWSPFDMVELPEDPKFFYATVGASQRVDLPNGEILIPMHFKTSGNSAYLTTVMRCSFDGQKLKYLEHGDELTRPDEPGDPYNPLGHRQTGLFEPSLVRFQGRYYLAMRSLRAAYVARSEDGLHFEAVQRWCFDDGKDIGCRNTQQHLVTHSDGLFLVYTRYGANNDHVFRSRAPLFIAQVDPEKLHVIRSTEQVLVPERGAALGNSFAVTQVNENETWVTVSEWMQALRGEILLPGNKYGADNSVFAARILWKTPNREID